MQLYTLKLKKKKNFDYQKLIWFRYFPWTQSYYLDVQETEVLYHDSLYKS